MFDIGMGELLVIFALVALVAWLLIRRTGR
jgi:hypothetical protein